MDKEFEKLIDTIFSSEQNISHIHTERIPEIPLYMDQVTSLMDELLSPARRYKTDKLLTKTMINNYAKNKLLPAPEKKKYTRQHMLLLILIYYFKGFLSLQDIQSLLKPLNEQYFGNGKECNIETLYDEIFSDCLPDMQALKAQVEGYSAQALASFPDTPNHPENRFLSSFALIMCLSMDVYLKKQMIERLIDDLNAPES